MLIKCGLSVVSEHTLEKSLQICEGDSCSHAAREFWPPPPRRIILPSTRISTDALSRAARFTPRRADPRLQCRVCPRIFRDIRVAIVAVASLGGAADLP